MITEKVRKIKHNVKLSSLAFYKVHLLRNYYTSGAKNYVSFPLKDILVCGMNRSGSTMLYNIIKLILQSPEIKADVYVKNDAGYITLLKALRNEKLPVLKVHHFSLLAKRRIEAGNTIAFFTHRDARDVCVSLIQKGWLTINTYFSKKVYKYHYYNSLLYSTVKHMHTFTYRELMEDKKRVILDVAKILNCNITDEAVEEIMRKTDLRATQKVIETGAKPGEYSLSSQLHNKHIADGKSDKYLSFFTEKELKKLNEKNKRFLRYFKYI